jgi:hypothetical protein
MSFPYGAHPLEQGEGAILNRVLSYVGPHQWLYVAGINRNFRGRYMQLVGREHMTTTPAACVSSLTRLELAQEAGLDLNASFQDDRGCCWSLQCWAGKNADRSVLLRGRELGMQWNNGLSCGAAQAGRLLLLQELHLLHGCPLGDDIAVHAACAPDPKVLMWLREIKGGESWSVRDMERMVLYAAQYGRIGNARWLRDVCGAQWHPDTLFWAAKFNQKTFLEWATSRDCPWSWPDSACSLLSRCEFSETKESYAWLHGRNDFPCNCAS